MVKWYFFEITCIRYPKLSILERKVKLWGWDAWLKASRPGLRTHQCNTEATYSAHHSSQWRSDPFRVVQSWSSVIGKLTYRVLRSCTIHLRCLDMMSNTIRGDNSAQAGDATNAASVIAGGGGATISGTVHPQLDVVCLNHTNGCGFTEFTGVHSDHQTPFRPAQNSFLEVTQSNIW